MRILTMSSSEIIRLVTAPATVHSVSLTHTEVVDGVDLGTYSIVLKFSPDDVEPLQSAIGKLMPKATKHRDPVDPLWLLEDGSYRLKAKSKFAVVVVDASKDVIETERVQAGDKVRIQVGFSQYSIGNQCGVTAYLGNVQLLKNVHLLYNDPEDSGEYSLPF